MNFSPEIFKELRIHSIKVTHDGKHKLSYPIYEKYLFSFVLRDFLDSKKFNMKERMQFVNKFLIEKYNIYIVDSIIDISRINSVKNTKEYKNIFVINKNYAKNNNSLALSNLGYMYSQGLGTRVNRPLAIKFLLKDIKTHSAKNIIKKNPENNSVLTLAFIYMHPSPKSYKLSIKYFSMAAKNGSITGINKLIEILDYEGKTKKAFYWSKIGAEKYNDYNSKYLLATLYYYGEGTKKNYSQAFKWFKSLLKHRVHYTKYTHMNIDRIFHNNQAQYYLGRLYEQGNGVAKNISLGIKYYKESVKNLDENWGSQSQHACYELAKIYNYGKYAKNNLKLALIYYKKLAKIIPGLVACDIGMIYYHHKKEKNNYLEAFKWFKKAVTHKVAIFEEDIWVDSISKDDKARAEFMIGTMFALGRGAIKNDKEANKWFLRSAMKNNAEAIKQIIESNIEKNKKSIAVKWYNKFISLSENDYYYIGTQYDEGVIVEKNIKKAFFYYKKALSIEIDRKDAKKSIRLLHKKGEITKAQYEKTLTTKIKIIKKTNVNNIIDFSKYHSVRKN